jgi:Protein of unknown function (DUF1573)
MTSQPSTRNAHGSSSNAPAPPRLWLVMSIAVLVMIVIGLVLASLPGPTPFQPEVTGAPFAQVSTTLIDHGDVPMDQYVESVFRIRNTGDQPLHILDEPRVELVQGCCPPRAIVSQMTLQPGEESTISLRFTMFDMMAGPHEFRVHVQTDDPTQPTIPLTILSNWVG